MKTLGIYIHIPFCESKCYYCDFLSFRASEDNKKKYVDYLIREIELYQNKYDNYVVDSIFIGGGTPSAIKGEDIYKILEKTSEVFRLAQDVEISIETNPNSIKKENLNIYRQAGINRISMGLQSMNNEILRTIGRTHTKEVFLDSYKLVRDYGFNNVNIDLMFNLPQQEDIYLKESLEEVILLEPEHISLYSLILEKGTKLYKEYKMGNYKLADENAERNMYYNSIALLEKNAYQHYEISNFCKRGKESRHNLKYWRLEPYLGLGLGAHSNMDRKRFSNVTRLEEYYKLIENDECPIENIEKINKEEEIFEYIIMNLRLTEGINFKGFVDRFKVDIRDLFLEEIEKNKKRNLLEEKSGYIRFTDKGRDLSNQVYLDFM